MPRCQLDQAGSLGDVILDADRIEALIQGVKRLGRPVDWPSCPEDRGDRRRPRSLGSPSRISRSCPTPSSRSIGAGCCSAGAASPDLRSAAHREMTRARPARAAFTPNRSSETAARLASLSRSVSSRPRAPERSLQSRLCAGAKQKQCSSMSTIESPHCLQSWRFVFCALTLLAGRASCRARSSSRSTRSGLWRPATSASRRGSAACRRCGSPQARAIFDAVVVTSPRCWALSFSALSPLTCW